MFHFIILLVRFELLSGTFWEIAARSVSNLFSLFFVYLYYLFISRFGFKSGICLLIAPVPVYCFSITFKPPVIVYITDRSKAVLLICSVFACFGVRFCTVFTFCVSR